MAKKKPNLFGLPEPPKPSFLEEKEPEIPAPAPIAPPPKTLETPPKPTGGQTFQIGNTQLSKADYDKARAALGFERGIQGAGPLTAAAAAAIQGRPGLNTFVENQAFRQEDVTQLQEQVAAEQAKLGESTIQEMERIRLEDEAKAKEDFIKRNWNKTRQEAEDYYEFVYGAGDAELKAKEIRLSSGDRIMGFVRGVFGELGKPIVGIGLNDFLDQMSDPTELSALTGLMSEAASSLPAIEGSVNNESIPAQVALAELNRAEQDGIILRGNMDRLAILRPEIVQTKEYYEMRAELDTYMADIRDARGTALEKLRTTSPEFNLLETQEYIRQVDKKKDI